MQQYLYNMSCIVRKQDFCLCENKGTDQLLSNCEADQRLCFRYTDSTIPLLLKFKILAFFCDCTGRFVLDLVGNPEARFSRVAASNKCFYFTANCSNDDCLLASLCRNPFNMSPVTLVTEGNIAHVRVFCHQESAKDGAIINYKVFNSLQDQGSEL